MTSVVVCLAAKLVSCAQVVFSHEHATMLLREEEMLFSPSGSCAVSGATTYFVPDPFPD
jgi:hypothetical protein